jgi:hypothetical protein
MLRRFLARGLLVTSLLTPALASAQSADPKVVAAQTLFDEGRALMSQKRFAEACKKLEASQKLDPGAGTLINLASCYEQNGQTASAWITFKDAAAASGTRHPDWASEANDQAAVLEPKLSRLTLVVTPTPGLEVKRDGVVVEPSTFGVGLPVDPGSHTIDASAPGHASFTTKIDVGAAKDDKSVTIPALAVVSSVPTQRIVGGVVAGVGGVGVIVGVVFGVIALGKKSDASNPSMCNAEFTTCSPAGKALVDDAKSAGLVSTVALVAGGVLAVGGVVFMLTAPHAKEKGPSVQASLGAPGAPWGLTLGGAF